MHRTPVPNPLLAQVLFRALNRCGGFPDLSNGWSGCAGWVPSSERAAETWPAEWFDKLPVATRDLIDASLSSPSFGALMGLPTAQPDPQALSRMLYTDKKGPVRFSLSKASVIEPVLASGRAWEGPPSAGWVIDTRPHQDAWIELDPEATWDPEISRLCLRLGAGLWFHLPARRMEDPARCPSLAAALEDMLCTIGWDQWVFPLADALEQAMVERLRPGLSDQWSQHGKLCKVACFPEWVWRVADGASADAFGALLAAMAWRMQQRFPQLASAGVGE